MATLSVWKFDTSSEADEASVRLQELARRGGVTVHDAATVSWERDARKPTAHQLRPAASPGCLGGSFWELLIGLIFLTDIGIDDTFINRVRDQLTPGTSALFVLGPDAAVETIESELAGLQPVELILAHLDPEQEGALRWVFTE